MAEGELPGRPEVPPEHDWTQIDGDTAVFGITWYAQDSLGDVVFFDPPEVGAQVTNDSAYAEVESVKAVCDVFAPSTARSPRSTRPWPTRPRTSTAIPTGMAGWSR